MVRPMPPIFSRLASLTTDNKSQYNNPQQWWDYLDQHDSRLARDILALHPKGQPSNNLVRALKDTHKAMLKWRSKAK